MREAIYATATQKMDVGAVGLILLILLNERPVPWHMLKEDSQVYDAMCSLQFNGIPYYPGDQKCHQLLENMLEIDPKRSPIATKTNDRFLQRM